jgi:hemolysin III
MTESRKPLLRGVSHQLAFFVALGAGLVLVGMSRSLRAVSANAVYAVTLASMFAISAAYHRGSWSERALGWWRRADHATIFLFIAGSYTPICLLAIGGPAGLHLLALVWIGAGLGALQALFWARAPRALTGLLGVALGWIAVAYWPDIRSALGPAPRALIIAGGALYTAGALVYVLRRPDPAPRVFGYHELFHALVIGASASHFAAVMMVVRGA